ncbi:MAG: DUF3320 domain-containing protein [Planctomycetes bacterium]|nr:DUF3320 domain-containing protein [Planctomycetota bacterium]
MTEGAATPPEETVARRLEGWRRRLLDLSRSNRLVHYRIRAASSVQVVREDAAHVADLVLAGKRLGFDPKPDDGSFEQAPETRGGDLRLQTPLDRERLERVLVRLFREARARLEEQGFHTLHLAFGMLEYETTEDDRPHRAPLLLVPVELERRGARGEITLVLADDEPRVNPALVLKLEQELGLSVELPDVEGDDDDPPLYPRVIAAFEALARTRPGWNVRHEVHLALFSFAKIPLYRDLLDHGEQIAAHPIVRAIAAGTPAPQPEGQALPHAEDVDAAVPTSERGTIVDADGSQRAALLAARRGFSYVLQGPPGTGKSQTIANLIAEALQRGERVLFVSEKMAALEVVRRRLHRAGLGDLVLELHSRMARPREVVASLGRAWERAGRVPADAPEPDPELGTLEAELAAYADALAQPRGALGLTAADVFARVAALETVPDIGPAPEGIWSTSAASLAARRRALAEAAELMDAVEPLSEHPWRGASLTRLGLDTVSQARQRAEAAHAAWVVLTQRIEDLAPRLGQPVPQTLQQADALVELAAHVRLAPPLPADMLGTTWSGRSPAVAALLAEAVAAHGQRELLATRYAPEVLAEDAADLARRARPGGFIVGWWRRRGVKRRLKRHALPGTTVDLRLDTEQLLTHARHRDAVAAGVSALASAFGPLWTGPDVDPTPLASARAWIERLHDLLDGAAPTPALVAAVGGAHAQELATATEAWSRERPAAVSALDALGATVGFTTGPAFGEPATSADVHDLVVRLEAAARAADALPAWAAWQAARQAVDTAGAGTWLGAFEVSGAAHDVLVDAWERRTMRAAAEELLAEDPVFGTFDGRRHEGRIERYVAADRAAQYDARARLAATWAKGIPPFDLAHVGDSETGLLRREMQKQRRHLAVRTLVERLPHLLPALKPCWMMSPLSVATFLPADGELFDLVVFDEASQIGTEDAVGAIARGQRLVVAGDERQLPPTRFFERVLALDEEAPEDGVEDLPSVLEECQAGPLPRLPLRWHYRSLDESLITFSNEHFYDHSLVTFPHPARDATDVGISFVHVADGVYEGGAGRSRTNPIEAATVAARAFELLAERPDESVGIVTFSTPQRDAVLDALDALRAKTPRFDDRFDPAHPEPVFVKNLESVQGDERDVILFSVGYGPDEHGVFRLHLGPLVAPGGDRRLNVAITRARRQVTVYSSVLPEAIDLDRSPARGVALLKAYLETARRGLAAPPPESGGSASRAGLAQALATSLAIEGAAGAVDVGASALAVDLALADPEHPARYEVAVLTDDGRAAMRMPVRDREHGRPAMLERLGWCVRRAWSPDVVRAPASERARLLEALEGACHDDAGEATASTVEAPAIAPDESSSGEAVDEPVGETIARERGDFPGVTPYRAAALRAREHPEGFHGASLGAVARALHDVVRIEGPVHLDRAVRLVTEAWGLSRATAKARERVEAALGALLEDGDVEREGEFVALVGAPVPVRRAGDGVERTIEEIAPAECRAAVLAVVDAYLGVAHETLVREAARALGQERLGERITETLDAAIADLVAAGALVESGDRLARAG